MGKKQQLDRWEPRVLPAREGKVKGHPSDQENSGGWEAAMASLGKRAQQGLFLPLDNLPKWKC